MNVYALKAYGHYGGGMAVVVAASEDEAKEVAGSIEDRTWHTQYRKPEGIELLPCTCDGPARVLTHYETGE